MAYRFGEFVLEPGGHRLLRGTQEFPLRPKTFQTLLYLVEHHDRVVSKDELLEEVWAGSFVVETVVPHSISELRAILEDNAHLPRYIKTVPKVGYKFIADVAPAESTSGAGTAVRQPRHSIAVMPFRDMSKSGDMEYFCEGLSEEIINALTHFPELRVAARTSSFALNKRACDAKEIGEKLNVETVLEGSLRIAGERLRVGAQLVEAAEGFHLWSEQFDCEMGDVLTIQDRISQKIVEHLQIGMLQEEGRSRSGRKTNNEDAYLLNMKGRHLMHRHTQEHIARAIEYFKKASEADAGYVHPHVGLSLCYSSLGFWSHQDLAEAYRKAKQSAITAVEIDPESSQAHAALGFAALISDWDWESADRSLRRSIELNPRSDWVRSLRAAYLLAVGRTAEAVAESRKAIELEPGMYG